MVFLDYVLSIVITVIIGFVIAFYKCRKFDLPNLSSKEILKKSIPMMVGSMFLLLLNWTDILMLGKMETEENIEKVTFYANNEKISYSDLLEKLQ